MSRRGPSFIVENIVEASFASLSVVSGYESAAPSVLPVTNLRTQEPTEITRITSLAPLATRWHAYFSKGVNRELSGMALVNAKLSPSGIYRFTSNAPTYEDLPPTSIVASTNATGVVGDVDEAAFAPDSSYIVPTDPTLAWMVKLGGYDPSGTPRSLAWFTVEVALVGSAPATYYPVVTATLSRWNGALEAPLGVIGWRAVTEASQLLHFTFDTAEFPLPAGQSYRVQLDFSNGESGSSYAKLGLARLAVETVAPAQDSGWIESPALAFGGVSTTRPLPTINLSYWPDEPWTGVTDLFVQLLDDQAEVDPEITSNRAIVGSVNRDYITGFVDAGVLVTGSALVFSSPGILLEGASTPAGNLMVEQLGGRTVGGQSYGADSFRARTLQVELCLTRDELLTLQTRLTFRQGYAGAFFFAAEPDIPVHRQILNSGWYTLASVSEPSRLPGTAYDGGNGEMLFVLTLNLEEKL